jgi:lysine-specific demethylase/histidyl-hydroxylase NO66
MAKRRLQQLLGQLPLPRFFADYFGKHWLHCNADPVAQLIDLVSVTDLEHLLFDRSDRDDFIKVAGGRADRTESSPTRFCSAQVAVSEWLSGKSLVFTSIDQRLPAISEFCRELEGELKCSVWCNLYLTPAGSNAFATHYDTHDVFVIQILGSKAWRVGTPAIDSPLPFQERKTDGIEIADVHERLVLNPNQVLYLPRGLLHDAVSEADLSCHLTIGIQPKTYLDLILTAVAIAADGDPRFRRHLEPGSFTIQEDDIAAAVRLMGEVSPDDFREAGAAFCELLASERRRTPAGAIRLLEGVEKLSEADYFRVIPNLMCSLSDRANIIELTVFGRSLEFPRSSQADLERCLNGTAFRMIDINASPNRSEFVRRLLLEGIVERLDRNDDRSPRIVDLINHIDSQKNPTS